MIPTTRTPLIAPIKRWLHITIKHCQLELEVIMNLTQTLVSHT